MSLGTVILLCNLTDQMAKPWLDAGYKVVMVDPQHPSGVNQDGLCVRVGETILGSMGYLSKILASDKVVFVAGFPPCTDVAVSGARWFDLKRSKDKHFQAKAALIAEQCRMLGMASGAPWFFENPVSVFSAIFGKPNYTFNPFEFTGYCPDDNYNKKTCLWTGGGFVMPKPFIDHTLCEPDNRIHSCPPSEDRGNIRSATPFGFSLAVFFANAPHLKIVGVAA